MSESKSLVVAEKAHSELGASIAARWMACPGSVRLSRGIPNTSSVHAQEGTRAHALAELCLRKGVEPSFFIDMEVEGGLVTEEMAEHVKVYVDHCREFMQAPLVESLIEQRFTLAKLSPPGPMFGTADFVWVHPESGSMGIVDLKYGQGVVVEAKGNKQLRYYALGAALMLPPNSGIDSVTMTIVQPRAAHAEGPIRSETIDYVELIDFAGELLEAARKTTDPDAPLAAGKHCRFCPASAICPAQRAQAQAIAQVDFEALAPERHVPPAPETLPVAVLAEFLPKLGILEQWITDVRAHARTLLFQGVDVPGYKIVEARSNRVWADEAAIVAELRALGYSDEEVFVQKAKSPAQVEKLLGGKAGKALVAEHATKKPGNLTMAPVTDKRAAVALTPGADFDVLPSSTSE